MRFFGFAREVRLGNGPDLGSTITAHVFAHAGGREKRLHEMVQFGKTLHEPRMQGQQRLQGIRHEHVGERVFAGRDPKLRIGCGALEKVVQISQPRFRFFAIFTRASANCGFQKSVAE